MCDYLYHNRLNLFALGEPHAETQTGQRAVLYLVVEQEVQLSGSEQYHDGSIALQQK